ncbi:MAG TPA: Ig-like domain repeat protein [Acidisarcina sp.]
MIRIEKTRPGRRNGIVTVLVMLATALGGRTGWAQNSAQLAALHRLGLPRLNLARPNGTEATNTSLALPGGVAFDAAGDLYIADTNNHIVLEVGLTGIVSTAAGTGQQGFAGDGGPATSALLDSPVGIALDSAGNLYIADSHNNRVREVSNGIISTIAGTGAAAFSGDGGPATAAALKRPTAVALDASGNVYIADTNNQRIREISGTTMSTVAGNGAQAPSGDGGQALAAGLDSPYGIAVDASGNLYIGDTHNQRVRMVTASTGIISTIAGTGVKAFTGDGTANAAALARPRGLAVTSTGTVYVADSDNNRIRSISGGAIITQAGNGSQGVAANAGPATGVTLNTPGAVGLFGNIFAIADTSSPQVLKVVPGGELYPVAGQPPGGTELLVIGGPITTVYGSGQLTARFKNGANTATGSVSFVDVTDPAQVVTATVPIVGSIAILNTAGLAVGSHLILAAYQGDAQNPAATSGAYVLVVTRAPLTAAATNITMLYGEAVPPLTGTLSGVLQQDSGNVTATFSTTATNASAVGVYPITAVLAGTAAGNYAVQTTSGSVHVAQAPTVTTLLAGIATPSTVTATVASTTTGTPTGTVNFYEAATLLNPAPIALSGGTATLPVATLPAGNHTIDAVYSGDSNFLTSTSNSVIQVISVPLDFTIALSPPSQTLHLGKTVSYTVTLTPVNSTFALPVTLSVRGLPFGVTASFAPSSIAAGVGASTTALSLTRRDLSELQARDHNSLIVSAGFPVLLSPVLMLPAAWFRRPRRKASRLARLAELTIMPLLMLASLGSLSGCGARPAVQTYTVTVVALSGTITHTTTLSLTLK